MPNFTEQELRLIDIQKEAGAKDDLLSLGANFLKSEGKTLVTQPNAAVQGLQNLKKTPINFLNSLPVSGARKGSVSPPPPTAPAAPVTQAPTAPTALVASAPTGPFSSGSAAPWMLGAGGALVGAGTAAYASGGNPYAIAAGAGAGALGGRALGKGVVVRNKATNAMATGTEALDPSAVRRLAGGSQSSAQNTKDILNTKILGGLGSSGANIGTNANTIAAMSAGQGREATKAFLIKNHGINDAQAEMALQNALVQAKPGVLEAAAMRTHMGGGNLNADTARLLASSKDPSRASAGGYAQSKLDSVAQQPATIADSAAAASNPAVRRQQTQATADATANKPVETVAPATGAVPPGYDPAKYGIVAGQAAPTWSGSFHKLWQKPDDLVGGDFARLGVAALGANAGMNFLNRNN